MPSRATDTRAAWLVRDTPEITKVLLIISVQGSDDGHKSVAVFLSIDKSLRMSLRRAIPVAVEAVSEHLDL